MNIDINQICTIAVEAGKKILHIYNSVDIDVMQKEDQSPLTAADLASHHYITEQLQHIRPDIPIISEESVSQVDYAIRQTWDLCWMIDPLDGTKEFIKRNGQFTVNIALIKNGAPILGVVYAPVLDVLYYADKNGAYKRVQQKVMKLPCKQRNLDILRVVVSNSHPSLVLAEYLEELQKTQSRPIEQVSIGSSLKLCLVAEGDADLYPRLGPTMEWDTAAGHAIVVFANGDVVGYEDSKPLHYNKQNLYNPFFKASLNISQVDS